MFDSFSPELIGAARLFLAVALAVTCLALAWEGIRRMRRERGISRQLDELSEFTSPDGKIKVLNGVTTPQEIFTSMYTTIIIMEILEMHQRAYLILQVRARRSSQKPL